MVLGSSASWFYDVTSGVPMNWCAVGDHGSIVGSHDDGQTWVVRPGPDPDAELYAVDFFDAFTGLAVGSHGIAWRTQDGGQTWDDVHTGLDVYLGAVQFLDASTALVVGEDGTALIHTF